jgi:uncharacterized membrane protein YfcA
MEYLWYGIAGVCGGLLGGMGMGGGTLLIPLLNIFYKVSQHTSQAVNLISFIPMAVIALIIHIKNKLVEFKKILYIILPGAVTCVAGCFIAKSLNGDLLGRLFGGFLLALSVYQFITAFKDKK